MKKIAIVGAGQSGLQLALGLLHYGYPVTLLTDKDAETVLKGRVTSSQIMFSHALNTERRLNINFWEDAVPPAIISAFSIFNPGDPDHPIKFQADLNDVAYSVDQRLKTATLMNHFIRKGGNLVIKTVTMAALNQLAEENDLVIVAAGRGMLSTLFPVNRHETVYDQPQRHLALTYVKPNNPISNKIRLSIVPDVGGLATFPGLTADGPCEIMTFEAIPGGGMDRFEEGFSAIEHLQTSLGILKKYLPEEYAYFSDAALMDKGSYFSGALTPTVRHPIFTLPSGKPIFGMGDAIVVNDPITGQGANSAAKCADLYLNHIIGHQGEFDRQWMTNTFNEFWQYAQHVVKWTNSFLNPPTQHMLSLFIEAESDPDLASQIANGYDDPTRFNPWWYEPLTV